MGYTTDFEGAFTLDKQLSNELRQYLVKFNETRRMQRKLPDHFGIEGEFYVDGSGNNGEGYEANIINHNTHPRTQPSLWCGWVPNKNGTKIVHDGGEKFYGYCEWIIYIIQNFLYPNGYTLSGTVKWQGEEESDFGAMVVVDNVLYIKKGIRRLGPKELFTTEVCKDQRVVMLESQIEKMLEIEPPKDVNNKQDEENQYEQV